MSPVAWSGTAARTGSCADPDRLHIAATAEFVASTYWAPEIPEAVVRRSVENSIAFGVYDRGEQIGFARVVTDRATFAWVGDVFVLESRRGLGLWLWLMQCVLAPSGAPGASPMAPGFAH